MRHCRLFNKTFGIHFLDILKMWVYIFLFIPACFLSYVLLGGEQSYGGGTEANLMKNLRTINKCVKTSHSLAWEPSTNPAYISHYLVFASQRRTQLESSGALLGIMPLAVTKNLQMEIPKRFKQGIYFFTVQAVSYGGFKSLPSKPISCLDPNQGRTYASPKK